MSGKRMQGERGLPRVHSRVVMFLGRAGIPFRNIDECEPLLLLVWIYWMIIVDIAEVRTVSLQSLSQAVILS